MTVIHPVALRTGNAPGGYTYGSTTYPVDDDGVVDCPEDLEADVAAALAERYGTDVDSVLEDAAGDGQDYEAMTYDELMDVAREQDVDGRSQMAKGELIDALED